MKKQIRYNSRMIGFEIPGKKQYMMKYKLKEDEKGNTAMQNLVCDQSSEEGEEHDENDNNVDKIEGGEEKKKKEKKKGDLKNYKLILDAHHEYFSSSTNDVLERKL